MWKRACFEAVVGEAPLLQKATQISNVPFVDESSGSDDDCGSQASFRMSVPCSEYRKTSGLGSPRAIKRGTEKGRDSVFLACSLPGVSNSLTLSSRLGIPVGNEGLASLALGGRGVGSQL